MFDSKAKADLKVAHSRKYSSILNRLYSHRNIHKIRNEIPLKAGKHRYRA
jgi:hypothetical protein